MFRVFTTIIIPHKDPTKGTEEMKLDRCQGNGVLMVGITPTRRRFFDKSPITTYEHITFSNRGQHRDSAENTPRQHRDNIGTTPRQHQDGLGRFLVGSDSVT